VCVVCEQVDQEAAAIVASPYGAVAQLVARLRGTQKVASSILVSSTEESCLARTERGFFLGGLVAGEGSFVVTRGARRTDGSRALRFVFQLSMASRDRHLLEDLRALLAFGSITNYARRKPNWEPMSTLTVNSRKAHVAATIPFMDAFLLAPTRKRVQYEQWKGALLAYELERPRKTGRSTCSEPGCEGLVRGRGLCRSHYYRATGW
jgi:hypothetical protein